MANGTFTLHRWNGVEQFPVSAVCITTYPERGQVAVCIEVEAARPPVSTLPDTEPLAATPNAEFTFLRPPASALDLLGFDCLISSGAVEGEWVARLYYASHEALDGVSISFPEARGLDLRFKASGHCPDVCHHGSKPSTRLEIDAWFRSPAP